MKKLTLLEMESDEEDNSTKKGLMGLKFMQDAIQKKREEAKLDAQKLLDDLEVVAREEEEADDDKEKNSKVFTGEELAKAAASLDVKSTTLAVSEPLTVKSTTASEPLAVMKKKKKKKVQETEEVRPKRKRKAEALPPQDLGYT